MNRLASGVQTNNGGVEQNACQRQRGELVSLETLCRGDCDGKGQEVDNGVTNGVQDDVFLTFGVETKSNCQRSESFD